MEPEVITALAGAFVTTLGSIAALWRKMNQAREIVPTPELVATLEKLVDARIDARIEEDLGQELEDAIERGVAEIQVSLGEIKDAVTKVEDRLAFLAVNAQYTADHNNHAIFWTNAKGENVLVSRYYLDTLGYSREDILGRRWESIVHPQDLPTYSAAFDQALVLGARFRERVRLRHGRTRKYHPVIATAEPVWRDGDLIGVVGGWELEPSSAL